MQGVTTGSCRHEAVDIAVKSLAPISKSTQATILGRKERFDILNAAFINGVFKSCV
jgi:2-methylcitrate dehydratase PrpD